MGRQECSYIEKEGVFGEVERRKRGETWRYRIIPRKLGDATVEGKRKGTWNRRATEE